MDEINSKKFQCKVCDLPTKSCCRICQQVFYCSPEHHSLDHKYHKLECQKYTFFKSITDPSIHDKELLFQIREKVKKRQNLRTSYMNQFINHKFDQDLIQAILTSIELSKDIYSMKDDSELFLIDIFYDRLMLIKVYIKTDKGTNLGMAKKCLDELCHEYIPR